MTIYEAREYLDHAPKQGLTAFTIFYFSPVSKTIEARDGYFLSYFEGKEWAEQICNQYYEMKIPYAYYIDAMFEEAGGNITNGVWRD